MLVLKFMVFSSTFTPDSSILSERNSASWNIQFESLGPAIRVVVLVFMIVFAVLGKRSAELLAGQFPTASSAGIGLGGAG